MNHYPSLRRCLAALLAFAIMGMVVVLAAVSNRAPDQPAAGKQPDPKVFPWPMWGGSLGRNLVNLRDHNVPTNWDLDKQTNILWVQDIGSRGYAGPVVADGKIFVGTNNEKPRDPNVQGDKGIIMCFEEGTGKFLWQRAHDKLPGGIVNDWPKEGICSTPAIDGQKVYYVTNSCQLVCATTNGKDVWALDMIK